MKIDILGVQAFVAIADHGGFQKVANALNITQTAITQRLRHLEDLLRVILVERTTCSVGLVAQSRTARISDCGSFCDGLRSSPPRWVW